MPRKTKTIITVDCETDPFQHGRVPLPFIWGAYNGTVYHDFDTTEKFLNFAQEQDAVIYAHNGGKFDWHFIADQIPDNAPIKIIHGRLSEFKIGAATFRDSYNILPFPLATYKKDEFDYALMEPEVRRKHMPAIKKYLRNDCVFLHEIVVQFRNSYGNGLTLAGSALKYWRKHYYGGKIPNTTAGFYAEMAPYYYGGRVECFKKGVIDRPFEFIDINSAYPRAMMDRHPFGESNECSKTLPESDSEIKRAFITLECDSRGAFPRREKHGLSFPHTRDTFNVTGHEYIAARDMDLIKNVDILKVYTFTESVDFTGYVEYFYDLKTMSEKDSADYIFAKLFLNSLYGKFGSNPENYEEFMIFPQDAVMLEDHDYSCKGILPGNKAVGARPLPHERRRYYNVATAASVTGYVRAFMLRALNTVDTPLYCDTDSIACYGVGDLVMSDRVGEWSTEAHCVGGSIAGKKMYAFEKENGEFKISSKGARLNEKEIYDIAKGGTVKYSNAAPNFVFGK